MNPEEIRIKKNKIKNELKLIRIRIVNLKLHRKISKS